MREIDLLNAESIRKILIDNPHLVKNAVLDALEMHNKRTLLQPTKQYLQREGAHTADRTIAMSVLAEEESVSGIKWIGSHPENYRLGMQRANSLIILNDTKTNAPVAILDGALISTLRTFAISLISLDRLHPEPKRVACLGMGRLGRIHANTLPSHYPSIKEVRCYKSNSVKDSFGKMKFYKDYIGVIQDTDVIITTTTTDEPYISQNDLQGNALLINLSLMDFGLDVYANSDNIIVDDWNQCSLAKKVFREGVEQRIIMRDKVDELSDILFRDREKMFKGQTIVNPIGMAIEDVMVARRVYDKYLEGNERKYFNVE
jgi:N-[(2S)-2-amino-2-carboxyethyl]-L-glutamate dehydrogenase